MTKELKPGDKVAWAASQGKTSGHVVKKRLTAGMAYMGPIADAGVDLSLCEHRHNQISVLAVERLLLLSADRTICPHFGLLVGQLADMASLGPLGTLMRVSDTLGDALRRLGQHLQIRTG